LAFKPNTDDMREAPSRVVVAELTRRGARVQAYDPVAMDEARRVMGDVPGLFLVPSAEAALAGADALLIVTEWREFRTPDFEAIKSALKQPLVLDGRNLYEPDLMRAMGIEYVGVGRGTSRPVA
jgi:UDPglucose 6-dehydrogenase